MSSLEWGPGYRQPNDNVGVLFYCFLSCLGVFIASVFRKGQAACEIIYMYISFEIMQTILTVETIKHLLCIWTFNKGQHAPDNKVLKCTSNYIDISLEIHVNIY